MMELQKFVSPLRSLLRDPEKPDRVEAPLLPRHSSNVMLVEDFPSGFHVYGITQGPGGPGRILVGAGDPVTCCGAIFLGDGRSGWKRIDLPDETALVSCFLRLRDGRYLAGGMNSIGRGALLMGDPTATAWRSVNLDLHSYGAVSTLFETADSTLVAATGQMVAQDKTKPVFFRSADQGVTWTRETQDLPISQFLSSEISNDGTIFLGAAGDQVPILYRSRDGARTFEKLPDLPAYKTYKTVSLKLVNIEGGARLFAVLWGYKTDLAERVVRIYSSTPDFSAWEELPEVGDSHFLFSFLVTRRGVFYAGSEKGKIFKSDDLGLTWETLTRFPTNIGAQALFEDGLGRIWVGKDFAAPSSYSLWRLT